MSEELAQVAPESLDGSAAQEAEAGVQSETTSSLDVTLVSLSRQTNQKTEQNTVY